MKQHPFFGALLVFSVFGLIAGHISEGWLTAPLSSVSPDALLFANRWIEEWLVTPLGREVSVNVVLCLGGFAALWTYTTNRASGRARRQERFSTW